MTWLNSLPEEEESEPKEKAKPKEEAKPKKELYIPPWRKININK
jgi:hypothetical protein